MNFFPKITQNQFFKVFSLNSFLVFLKLIFGFGISKMLAVFVGPSGMGILGNFRVFTAFLENFSLLGIQNAVVKYVAEYKHDKQKTSEFLIKIFAVLLFLTIISSLMLLLFIGKIEAKIFGDFKGFKSILALLILCLPFFIFSTLCVSILNGLGWFKKTILANLISSIIVFMISAFLIYFFGIYGALIAIIINPIVLFVVAFIYLNEFFSKDFSFSYRKFDFTIIKNLSEFILMAVISGVLGSLVLLAIRTHLVAIVGIEKAGIYEGLQRISSNYMVFVTSIVSLYFYPKLAKSFNKTEISKQVWIYLKFVIPVLGLGLFLVYFFRQNIISLLFTHEFNYMKNLFFWQLTGDFFKALSLIFGTVLIAKKMTKTFLFTEIFSLAIMYFLSVFYINEQHTNGIVLAYALTYIIYFVVMILVFYQLKFKPKN